MDSKTPLIKEKIPSGFNHNRVPSIDPLSKEHNYLQDSIIINGVPVLVYGIFLNLRVLGVSCSGRKRHAELPTSTTSDPQPGFLLRDLT